MADFFLVRTADNVIVKEALGYDPRGPAPKAGLEWREWVRVINDISTGANKVTLAPVRTFVTEGGHLTANIVKDTTTIRDMTAPEIDADKTSKVGVEFKTVAFEAFWETYNVLFMLWRISNPTGTKAQFASAVNTWLATEGSGTQVALTHDQVREHLKGFLT
jgi:hypothetical protein